MKAVAPLIVLLAGPAMGEEEPPPVWSGQTGVSYVATTGNTDTSTLGASGGIAWRPGKFALSLQSAFVRIENARATTSKRVDAALRVERTLQERVGAYAQGAYYRDLFAGMRSQEIAEAGGIYRFLHGETSELAFSLSLAQTWEDRVTDPDRGFLGAKTGVQAGIRFNGAVAAECSASYLHDFSDAENWRGQGAAKLTSSLGGVLAVELAYKLYFTNAPAPGLRRADATATASLVAAWPRKSK